MDELLESASARGSGYLLAAALALVVYARERHVRGDRRTWPTFWLVSGALLITMGIVAAGDVWLTRTRLLNRCEGAALAASYGADVPGHRSFNAANDAAVEYMNIRTADTGVTVAVDDAGVGATPAQPASAIAAIAASALGVILVSSFVFFVQGRSTMRRVSPAMTRR